MWAASHQPKIPTETINAMDEYHDNCGGKHPHCQQDQVSHRPLRHPSDADLLLVWPLLLLLSPRHRHGLFAGDGRLPNWLQLLQLLRPSRLTWIAKREAVRLPSRLQFIDSLGRPALRNAKLFGFPPGQQPSDADLLLVWSLLLLLSPRHRHGLFAGDGRIPNWLQLLRPSRYTRIAKREAVRRPSWLQFLGP